MNSERPPARRPALNIPNIVEKAIKMTAQDQTLLALTAWRENRGGGRAGMQSVMNVIMNRCAARHLTAYEVCTQRLQFSSITAPGDPQLVNWPVSTDPAWNEAIAMADSALNGELADITDGATYYFAKSIPKPTWADSMTQTADIAGQLFYKEA